MSVYQISAEISLLWCYVFTFRFILNQNFVLGTFCDAPQNFFLRSCFQKSEVYMFIAELQGTAFSVLHYQCKIACVFQNLSMVSFMVRPAVVTAHHMTNPYILFTRRDNFISESQQSSSMGYFCCYRSQLHIRFFHHADRLLGALVQVSSSIYIIRYFPVAQVHFLTVHVYYEQYCKTD